MRTLFARSLVGCVVRLVAAIQTTDSLQDADAPQSGYLPSHNIDPTILGTYKQKWVNTYASTELFLAKPLVYTPSGSSTELVILVSNMNVVRVLDSATGNLVYTRTLDAPFTQADAQCGDVSNFIGIIGTPYIDAATEVMYFFSKGYKPGTTSGTINGQYKMYAVELPALQDVQGFPVVIDGHYANNDITRYFVGGTLLQRPGLASIGNSIVAGFGGHCDNFNYTGMLVTVSKTSGVGVTNIQAMVASPGAPSPQPTNILDQTGGKAGIWQSGTGLTADIPNNRVYFSTGNGRGPGVNGANKPNSGKNYISTVEQAVASYTVGNTGSLSQADWFEPIIYDQWNGGDRDVGSSGVSLLDPGTFTSPNVKRIAITAGKAGMVYVLDANNLGGFMTGPGNSDNVIQTFTYSPSSFFGGIGSYPLESGYIYLCPTNGPLYAYKYGLDGNGSPQFALAGQSDMTFAGQTTPTVTSLNGKIGTGVVWMADINQGLVPFNAIPQGGKLVPYTFPASGRLTKFQRPAFGNQNVYTSRQNSVLAFGPPGSPPPPPSSTTTKPVSTSSTTSSSKTSTSSTTTSKSSTTTSVSSTKSSSSSTSRTSTSSTTSQSTSTSSSSSSRTSTSSTSSKPTTSSSSTTSKPTSSSSTTRPTTSSTTSKPTTTLLTTTKPSSTSTSTSSSRTSSSSSTSTIPYPSYTSYPLPKGLRRTYNWNVTWVSASPDGFKRPFVGINGQWPCPPLTGNIGDIIVINVYNALGNQSTAIHFHGLYQKNTTYSDGAAMVTQCPIMPGESFVYQFTLTQSGTYWYHAHLGGQYIDGFRGPLIISDPHAPYKVDKELTLTLTDLYHQQAPYLIHNYLSPNNTMTTGGAEPVPDSALINEAQNVKFSITPGKSYLFHVINMGALAGHYLQFDQHTMTIVEVDGVYTLPQVVNQLFVGAAQRYKVIVQAKATDAQNYAVVSQFDTDMFDSTITPAGQQATVNAWLVYNAAKPLPAPFTLQPQPWDDSTLVPWDEQSLMDPADQTIYLTADFGQNDQQSTRGFFNGQTYVQQKVPTMFTALTAPADVVTNPTIYGSASNPFVLPSNAIIEVTIHNHDTRAHPFHLHGHNFQLISRSDNGPLWPGLYTTPTHPMRRDTVIVYPGGGATIRFRADNPGINLFHCHTEFHVESGLVATFVEAPDVLQALKLYVPVSHRDACDKYGIPRKGNAGGNSRDWLDTSGMNTEPVDPGMQWGAMVAPPTS